MAMTEILLIDGQHERHAALVAGLREHGIQVNLQAELPANNVLTNCHCVVCAFELIEPCLSDIASLVPTIVLADNSSVPTAVACIRRGAADYLDLPVTSETLLAAIERATANTVYAQQQTLEQFPMIGSSPVMQTLKESIAKVAPTDSTVLILGQSGTGKELVARALHAGSNRSSAPLISINCATVPQNLIEAELFGLDQFEGTSPRGTSPRGTSPRGSGAHSGLIQAAEGGTLFLDEVAELPPAAQARLLKVLQGENRRVGSTSTDPVNVRIIVATHRNLHELTEIGQFRQDLFYRLNVICFELPPLHQRREDVMEIAEWLLQRTSARLNKVGLNFSPEAEQAMNKYHWPGNVRELENAIERAVILADNNCQITQALLAIVPISGPVSVVDLNADGDQTSLEDYFVRFVLDNQDFSTETELAEKLGISRKSLWERRQRLNIPRRKTRKRGPRRDTTSS